MRVLLDTSVLVALGQPGEVAPDLVGIDAAYIATLSYAELAMGLAAARDVATYRLRSGRLTLLRQRFGSGLPFTDACVEAYSAILAEVDRLGGQVKASRFDRMIGATAMANDLTVVTRNSGHLEQLAHLVPVEIR